MPRSDPEKNREYQAKWYIKNKELHKERIKEQKRKKVLWLLEYKRTLFCENCRENHPSCLEFHHVEREKKDFALSTAANRGFSWERIKKELEKCKVLCSNCHRKLHWHETKNKLQ